MSDFFARFCEAQDRLKSSASPPQSTYHPKPRASRKKAESDSDYVFLLLVCAAVFSCMLVLIGAAGQIAHSVSMRDTCEMRGYSSITIRKTVLCVDVEGRVFVPDADASEINSNNGGADG